MANCGKNFSPLTTPASQEITFSENFGKKCGILQCVLFDDNKLK